MVGAKGLRRLNRVQLALHRRKGTPASRRKTGASAAVDDLDRWIDGEDFDHVLYNEARSIPLM